MSIVPEVLAARGVVGAGQRAIVSMKTVGRGTFGWEERTGKYRKETGRRDWGLTTGGCRIKNWRSFNKWSSVGR
jgi:hypothetical protein